jgi:outer membrane protein
MKRVFTVLMLAFAAISFNQAQAQTKIGIISPDEVFGAMPETKKADSNLAAFQKALQETYQDQETELNTALEKFVKDSAKMTPAVKEAKRTDLQARISELQNKQQQLNQALEAEKEKQIKPIREKIFKAIQDVAKENGYAYVFYKESAIVSPEADDITDRVKKKLGIKVN